MGSESKTVQGVLAEAANPLTTWRAAKEALDAAKITGGDVLRLAQANFNAADGVLRNFLETQRAAELEGVPANPTTPITGSATTSQSPEFIAARKAVFDAVAHQQHGVNALGLTGDALRAAEKAAADALDNALAVQDAIDAAERKVAAAIQQEIAAAKSGGNALKQAEQALHQATAEHAAIRQEFWANAAKASAAEPAPATPTAAQPAAAQAAETPQAATTKPAKPALPDFGGVQQRLHQSYPVPPQRGPSILTLTDAVPQASPPAAAKPAAVVPAEPAQAATAKPAKPTLPDFGDVQQRLNTLPGDVAPNSAGKSATAAPAHIPATPTAAKPVPAAPAKPPALAQAESYNAAMRGVSPVDASTTVPKALTSGIQPGPFIVDGEQAPPRAHIPASRVTKIEPPAPPVPSTSRAVVPATPVPTTAVGHFRGDVIDVQARVVPDAPEVVPEFMKDRVPLSTRVAKAARDAAGALSETPEKAAQLAKNTAETAFTAAKSAFPSPAQATGRALGPLAAVGTAYEVGTAKNQFEAGDKKGGTETLGGVVAGLAAGTMAARGLLANFGTNLGTNLIAVSPNANPLPAVGPALAAGGRVAGVVLIGAAAAVAGREAAGGTFDFADALTGKAPPAKPLQPLTAEQLASSVPAASTLFDRQGNLIGATPTAAPTAAATPAVAPEKPKRPVKLQNLPVPGVDDAKIEPVQPAASAAAKPAPKIPAVGAATPSYPERHDAPAAPAARTEPTAADYTRVEQRSGTEKGRRAVAEKPAVAAPAAPAARKIIHDVGDGDTLTHIAGLDKPAMKRLYETTQKALGESASRRDVLNVLAIVLAKESGIGNVDRIRAGKDKIVDVAPETIQDVVKTLKGCELVDSKGHISPGFVPREVSKLLACPTK